jgi:hypothetical protein
MLLVASWGALAVWLLVLAAKVAADHYAHFGTMVLCALLPFPVPGGPDPILEVPLNCCIAVLIGGLVAFEVLRRRAERLG